MGYIINLNTYNRTENTEYEFLRIQQQQDENSEIETYDTDHKLGKILLLIMKTVPIMEKWNGAEEGFVSAISPQNPYFKKLRNIYGESEECLYLFDSFLYSLYFSDYIAGFGNEDGVDFEFAPLKSIYNYILLCMENREYYSIERLLMVASATRLELKPATVTIAAQHKEDMPLLRQLSIEDLKTMFSKTIKYSSFYSYDYYFLSEICFSSLCELIRSNLYIKKCEHCGEWFIEYSKNEKYCDGNSPIYPGLSCKQAARNIKEAARLSGESTRLLKNLRQMFDNSGLQEEKAAFNTQVSEWRSRKRNGTATEEEFIAWIKSNYKTKYKD